MKRPTQRCEQCSGPMEVFMHGGDEPDPDRKGKTRPATTATIVCWAAMEARAQALAAARRQILEQHAAHTTMIRVPWPPVDPIPEPAAQLPGLSLNHDSSAVA